ncbi:MAG: hypothetical protein H6908_01820 [Hyphomicrobiales bacterium]|nr:hypothetical protein [Hyphomicrobiales bacterium]
MARVRQILSSKFVLTGLLAIVFITALTQHILIDRAAENAARAMEQQTFRLGTLEALQRVYARFGEFMLWANEASSTYNDTAEKQLTTTRQRLEEAVGYLKNYLPDEAAQAELRIVDIAELIERASRRFYDGEPSQSYDLIQQARARADAMEKQLQILLNTTKQDANRTNVLVADETGYITWISFGSLLVLGLLIVLLLVLVRIMVSQPATMLAHTLHRLAEEPDTVRIPEDGNYGLLQEAGSVLTALKQRLVATPVHTEIKEVIEETIITTPVAEASASRPLQDIARDVEQQLNGLLSSLTASENNVLRAAERISTVVQDTNAQTGSASAACREAADSVSTVASAVESLSDSIAEIARQASQSTTVTRGAVQTVDGAGMAVNELSDAASKIGEVVNIIRDIAEQTNLLALNATIEAARVGEAGKGFAVVASEVKTLAEQTSRATEDIARQVGNIQGTTKKTVEAIEKIGDAIRNTEQITTAIAAAVEQQQAATQGIASSAQQAANMNSRISTSIGDVSQHIERTRESANNVLDTSKSLSSTTSSLQQTLQNLLERLKAA